MIIFGRRKENLLVAAGLLLLAGAAATIGTVSATSGSSPPGSPPAAIGDQLDRPIPNAIARAGFLDQQDHQVTLRNFAGRVVFLVPFLTSCQEECPITTGALEEIKRALVADHLDDKVAIVEVTVDPGRDTPERMSAYARLTGTSWPLLTASPNTIATLWHYFGIYYQVVPEASPPGIDWQTQRPYAYDVDHSDGFILLNPHLDERFVAAGMVSGARVSPTLRSLLDSNGLSDLTHPGGGSWTVGEALDAIGWLAGQNVPSHESGA